MERGGDSSDSQAVIILIEAVIILIEAVILQIERSGDPYTQIGGDPLDRGSDHSDRKRW